MGVDVDEARGHDPVAAVDGLPGLELGQITDGTDAPTTDRHVGATRR